MRKFGMLFCLLLISSACGDTQIIEISETVGDTQTIEISETVGDTQTIEISETVDVTQTIEISETVDVTQAVEISETTPTSTMPPTTTLAIIVPNVLGEWTEDAVYILNTFSLEAVIVEDESLNWIPGIVTEQNPLPGTILSNRSVVILSTTPETSTTPTTNPPATNPPTTNPPTTNPPDTTTPATNPPTTNPPDTNQEPLSCMGAECLPMLSMNSTQESMITASIRSPLRCAGEYPPPGASSQPEGWVPLEVEQTWKSRHSVRVEIPFESTSVAGYDGPLDLPGLEHEVHYAIKEIGEWSGVPDNQWTLYYPYGSDNPDAGGASLWSPPGSRLDGWFVMDCLRSGAMYHFKITLKYYDCHLLDLPQRGPGMPHNCADGAPYILTITVPEIEDAGECPRLNPTTPDCLMLDETTPDVAVPSETTSNTSLPSEEECHASLSSVLSGPVTCAGIDLRGWNPQLDNYDNADFRGAILDGVVFKDNKSFINANFDDASLVGVQVGINASSGCRYTYDDWGNILSRLCDFSGASFQNSDLTNFAIVKSNLNFDNTNFTGANFTGAKLNRMNPDTTCADGYWNFTSLNGAIMDNVDFTVADTFCGLDFVGASLVNTNLSGLTLGQSDFRNANLTGANLSEINREVTHSGYARHFKVDGAIMINANFEGSRLSDFGGGTNNGFMGVDLTGQDFRGFDLERVDFRGAILDGVTFGDNNCGTGSTKVKWSLDFPPVCP